MELLWSPLKERELTNLAGDHLADVAYATEQGICRINQNQQPPLVLPPPTLDSPSTHQPHRSNEKISKGCRVNDLQEAGIGSASSGALHGS
ncbi:MULTISPECIES: hypothetical protein [unclassified Streptomyces]|uniref:hypothetical protein n=1 Tax=unclassified Streptomyces TaxID=2593676 RepID=UPI0036F5BED7